MDDRSGFRDGFIQMEEKRHKKILLIDDEETVGILCKKMLERLGHNVIFIADSSEALGLFRDDPLNFDCIIADLFMPKMGGEELTKEMLKIRQDIPIILYTGFGFGETEKRKLIDIGIKGFIAKPFSLNTIASVISSL